jgi:hypothetical protein
VAAMWSGWSPPTSTIIAWTSSPDRRRRGRRPKGPPLPDVVADHDRDGVVVWVARAGLAPPSSGSSTSSALTERPGLPLRRWTCLAPTPRSPAAARRRPGVCADPFHVIKLVDHALDQVRRAAWNRARLATGIVRRRSGRIRPNPRRRPGQAHPLGTAQRPATLTGQQRATLDQLRRAPPRAVPCLGTEGGTP